MNKKIILVLLICLGAPFLSGCDVFWGRYHDRQHGFSILVPRFWQRQVGVNNIAVMIVAGRDDGQDKFPESINVVVTELSGEVDLSAFFEMNKAQIVSELPGGVGSVDEDIYAGGMLGKLLSFKSIAKDTPVYVQSAIWKKGKRFYIISSLIEVSRLNKYKPLFEKITRSLRIK